MVKKIVHLFITVVFLVTTGFGCKGLTSQQQTAVRPVVLNYWTVYDDLPTLKKFADEYRQMRPYVTVNIRQVRSEEFDRLFANALADDVGPDIVSLHNRWLGRYQNRLSPMPSSVQMARVTRKSKFNDEITVTLETLGLPSVSDVRGDYVKAVTNDVVVGGQVYGLPLAFDTLAIYYNKDLLDRSGVPTAPKTWDEFVDAVKKTTRFDKQGRIAQAGTALGTAKNIDNAFDIVSLLMMQSGVKMTRGGAVTFAQGVGEGTANHPAIKALDFYTNFSEADKEAYSWNDEMGTSFDEFVRGKVVFYFGNGFDGKRIKARAPEMSLEVIPVPQLNANAPVNVANYWVESVVQKSKHQNEAWDFVRYITSPDNVKRYVEATSQPTPLRAQIKDQSSNLLLAPFVSQVLFAENWYRGKDAPSAEKAFDDLITQYREPAQTEGAKLKRDGQLLTTAAQVVQQTF